MFFVLANKIMEGLEQAMKNTIIAFKLMSYSYSLLGFFKEEFRKNDGYLIPFSHILHFKRNVFPLIRDSCDYVCPYTKPCHGHLFLDFIEKLYEFQQYAVIERKCFFRDFYFYDFRLKRDEVHEMEKVFGWDFKAVASKNLSHLSYSQRCHYLN